jgi:hypothetical protein
MMGNGKGSKLFLGLVIVACLISIAAGDKDTSAQLRRRASSPRNVTAQDDDPGANLKVAAIELRVQGGRHRREQATNSTWWKPKASDLLSWQWTLQGPINTGLNVDVYDVDLFDTPKSTIQVLQARGIKVICYFSAGTYEGWRSDWKTYFPFITGGSYTGGRAPFAGNMADWDERWLDIRYVRLLRPIMTARIRLAVSKGCDAVEPDNMDAYTNLDEVGKPITAAHQLRYNRMIANTAHQLGMSVGLKNDLDQLPQLVSYYDFAVNEQCFQYNECSAYTSTFVQQDKAVFGAEYQGNPAVFCPKANQMKLSFQKKTLALKQWRIGCENY